MCAAAGACHAAPACEQTGSSPSALVLLPPCPPPARSNQHWHAAVQGAQHQRHLPASLSLAAPTHRHGDHSSAAAPRTPHHAPPARWETRATAVESSEWRRETCSSGHAGPAGACTALLLNHRQQHANRAVRSMLTWMSWRGPTRSGSYRTCRRAQAGVLSNTNWCQLPDF